MPSFRAAWIMAGLTGVGSGAAPLSGSGKTALNAITIDALSTSRLENFRSCMTFAPLTAASRERALVMPATPACAFGARNCPLPPLAPQAARRAGPNRRASALGSAPHEGAAESRGAQFRRDFPTGDPAQARRT